ncbi:MAG: histidinol-phosphate transaminase [Nitrospinae bacterium RIFCSPLOWO2_12_39_16]|nr:MAG: histidinol-phosphate transaminase [Nitrospinae bacterium RIFCSPLOWO2_02_39_17]OGW12009.1 MAG: histidinol-phosphate transaminase [Nitrospinae bacterium RIFCSPLOWO2_12_39_16]HLA48597.1 histidinol-phosphate transaminase [Nitrospinota bacterium]
MVSNISNLVKKSIQKLKPYHIENTPCRIKLDAMENPYPLSKALMKKVLEGIKGIKINRYPDPLASRLKDIIASDIKAPIDNIIIGNGSDELIQLILTAFGEHGDRVLLSIPTFSMYGIIARSLSLMPEGVPLDKNWELPLNKFLSDMERIKPKVIFISYPNNPTGNSFDRESILKVLEKATGIVVIDEAYYNFSRKTFLPYLKEYKNLIILRTLSKIGMAGLRVGYLMADKEICQELNKVRLPYNSNALSQEIASIILENRTEIQKQIGAIISERDRLMEGFKEIKGIEPYPSETNFILFKIDRDSKEVFDRLSDNGILVRNFGNDDYLKNCLRVTIGTSEENDEFLDEIKKIIT